MKKTTFTLVLLLSCYWLAAQCPTNITFSTQGQVDSFHINYPNCTVITGNVVIADSSIVRLDSLYALKKIGGRLEIRGTSLPDLKGLGKLESVKLSFRIIGNPALTGLTGLGNLKTVGEELPWFPGTEWGFEILDNPLLASLHGLDKLTTAAGCVKITNNPSLISLAGLGSLSSVGVCYFLSDNAPGYVDAGLNIGSNASLTTLDGIGSLDSLRLLEISGNPVLTSIESLKGVHGFGSVRIWNNAALASLSGFDQVQRIGGDLSIYDNPSLTSIALGNIQEIGGGLTIWGNLALKSLAPIGNIQSIGGDLSISGNPSLTSIDPLGNIQEIGGSLTISGILALKSLTPIGNIKKLGGGLGISLNPSLKSLSGLDNIQNIRGSLSISGNDSLATLSGLENLDTLGACLTIAGNPALVSLDALAGLLSIGYCRVKKGGVIPSWKDTNMRITDNLLLASIQGLDQVTFSGPAGADIYIGSCPGLSVCEIHSICQNLGKVIASGNAPGCNSVPEIEAACTVPAEEAFADKTALLVFPNPVTDALQIQLNDHDPLIVSIYDPRGRLLLFRALPAGQPLDVQGLLRGLYALKVVAGERVYVGRFVKQ